MSRPLYCRLDAPGWASVSHSFRQSKLRPLRPFLRVLKAWLVSQKRASSGAPVPHGQHLKPFSVEAWNDLRIRWYASKARHAKLREGGMSVILAIISVPLLSATGIYNPPVVHHGHCIAQPGSYDALFCGDIPAAPPPTHRHRASR